jgi:hypothetical protein
LLDILSSKNYLSNCKIIFNVKKEDILKSQQSLDKSIVEAAKMVERIKNIGFRDL